MDAGLGACELTVRTGNAVTDVIVNDKKKTADKLGVKFQTDILLNLTLTEIPLALAMV